MGDLTGKVGIVTGASRGIGRAIAERLARDGVKVVVNVNTSMQQAHEVVTAIEAGGGQATAIQANIGVVADVRRLFQETLTAYGHVDILINNAGTYKSFEKVADVTEEDYDAIFAVNAKGPFFAMQEAARVFRDNGRIVNISTRGTRAAIPGYYVYGGSKSTLEQFTVQLSLEFGPRGITVNTVLPGPVETQMLHDILALLPEGTRQMVIARTPLGRLGHPTDIGDVVAFLCSDDGRWVTGQTIAVDGGLV